MNLNAIYADPIQSRIKLQLSIYSEVAVDWSPAIFVIYILHENTVDISLSAW